MSLLQAIVLGFVQGLTEFLPISSSGHLVLVGELLGLRDPGVLFVIAVHVGTLLSVLIYFRAQLWQLLRGVLGRPMRQHHWTVVYLGIATIPAVVLYLLTGDFFETVTENENLAAVMLCVTGGILFLPDLARRLFPGRTLTEVNLPRSLAMGLGQAFALFPGISRSGATIASGMVTGVDPSKAAEFSFMMAIPVIAGGALFKVFDVESVPVSELTPCLIGAVVAFLSGLFAIYAVLNSIRRGKFRNFAYYCFAVGLSMLFYFNLR